MRDWGKAMRAARFLAVLLVLAAGLAAVAYAFRLPLAGWAARRVMAGAGVEAPAARVTALSFSHLRLEDVAAGPVSSRDFFVENIEAEFHWRRLWRERKADLLRVGPGRARIIIDEAGGLSVAGFKAGAGGANDSGALPFDRFVLDGLSFLIVSPDGDAVGMLKAEYDFAQGGSGAISLEAEQFSWNGIRLSDMAGSANAELSADGLIKFEGSFGGDAETSAARLRGFVANLDGEASSWRDGVSGAAEKLEGAARVTFAAPKVEIAGENGVALMGADAMQTVFGAPVREAALSGAVDVSVSQSGIAAHIAEGAALKLETPDGAMLTLSPGGEAPFIFRSDERENASFRFSLASEGVDASGGVDFLRQDGEWRLAAPIDISEFALQDFALHGGHIDLSASSSGDQIDADITVESGLRRAKTGRLTVLDAPVSGAFRIQADMAAKRASIFSKNDCVAITRGRGQMATLDLDMQFTAMTLCNDDGPLVTAAWGGPADFTLAGELAAQNAAIRFGKTRAQGRPPVIRFDASHRPSADSTHIKGAVSGGDMALLQAIDMSAVAGRFDFSLGPQTMRASADINRLRIEQHQEKGQAQLAAPVIAAGEALLEGDKARFSYAMTTPEGRNLGRGEGWHDMLTATGETVFTIDDLSFAPGALQPSRVFPPLKGIVDAAEGAVDASMRFAWSPKGPESSAQFKFSDISFGGPTRAVTRTSGVSGTVQLTNLFPMTTNGMQTITVGAVDMDALQLGEGVVSFAFPGDDSVILEKAEFPWFGGTLGAYDAKAAFSGEAVITLRAANVDLEQIFDYVDVEGLSGEGVLSGELPVTFEGGKARIDNGYFQSQGAGVIRYTGKAGDAAASAGEQAKIAFDLLRDLRYRSMTVSVNGPLDGRLEFAVELEGTGEVTVRDQAMVREGTGRVPVIYRINLDAALLELLNQANLSRSIGLQIEKAQRQAE